MKKLFLAAFVLFLLSSTVAKASHEGDDFQLWSALTATGPLSNEQYLYWLEGQARFGNDVSRLSQTFFRPAIGYKLSEKGSLWLGYGWFYTGLPFAEPSVYEQRLWQQFLWNSKLKDVSFSSRTRLEQRKFNGSYQIGWRFRQAIRFLIPLPKSPRYFIVLGDEVFLHLRNPSNDKFDPQFDQNRLAAGLGMYVTQDLMMDIGYINQRIKSFDSDPSFTANILAINANFKFS